MITVTLRKQNQATSVLVDENTKLADFITQQALSPSVTPYLDGAPISTSQLGKTFKELEITETCLISAVVKTNNA